MASSFHIGPLVPLPELRRFIILRCVIGSRAYGLEVEGSDWDRRGVYLPSADLEWGLFSLPEQIEDEGAQECYWELRKFLVLALKANPNIWECLWSPLVEYASPLGLELVGMRGVFLSKLAHRTYNNYVLSQFEKLAGDLGNRGAMNWKHAMHLVRLLLTGITILREGRVEVRVGEEFRERLLAIKLGRVSWEEVDGWRRELHGELDAALLGTGLPEGPDVGAVNDFLLRARRGMV